MKTVNKNKRRDGAILAMALILVLVLGILAATLLSLREHVGVEVSRNINSEKAFWGAEAGLTHAKAMLLVSESFRNTPWVLSGANPNYMVTSIPGGGGVYTNCSTGTVVAANRVVWQTVRFDNTPAAFSYALFGGNGDMWLRKSANISGSVYQNGNINMVSPATVTNGTVSVSSTNDTLSAPVNVPTSTPSAIPFPVFDPVAAGYSNLITTAAAVTNTTFPPNLGGKTNYVKSASLGISTNIYGPGVLVVSGDVTINDNVNLTTNIQIIAGGTLILNCSPCTAGSNCLIYANAGITVPSKDVTIGTVNLITMGNAGPLFFGLTVTGTLYAAGAVDARKTLTVVGSVLAGTGIEVRKDFNMVYANYWPIPLLPGFTPEPRVTDIFWQEKF